MKITIIIFSIIGFIALIEQLIKFLGNPLPVIDASNSRIKIPLAKK